MHQTILPLALALPLMLAGCVAQRPPVTPIILDGSKADAMLTYGYDFTYAGLDPPGIVDWQAALPNAIHRCQSWDYAGAEALGTVITRCHERGGNELIQYCRRERQEQKFACVDDAG